MKNTTINPKTKKKNLLLKLTPFLISILGMITIGLLSCSGVRAAHFLPTSSSAIEIEAKAPTGFGKISGYAWYDGNQDGWKNENESWQHGCLLLKQNSEIIMEIYPSMLDGYYEIDSIPPGNYYLTSDAPFPFLLTRGNYNVEIEAGTHLRDMHFVLAYYGGDELYASLRGAAWYDTNNNGLYDTDELGADSIQVFAELDTSFWYPLNPSNPYPDTTYIDTIFNGRYQFPLTELGSYFVSIDVPEGYQTPQETYYGETGITGMGLTFEPDPNQGDPNQLNFRFPLYPISNDTTIEEETPPAEFGKISGYAWIDTNQDGWKQDDEFWASGTLILKQGSEIKAEVWPSPEDGYYEMDSLPPGNYYLTWNNPGPFIVTRGDYTIEIEEDTHLRDMHFIVIYTDVVEQYTDLSGMVWYDTNNNSLYDAGEVKADGIQVFAQGDTSFWYQTPLDTTYIDTVYNGYYQFPFIELGSYFVSIDVPEGYQTPQESYYGKTESTLLPDVEEDYILEFNFPLYPISNDTTIEEETDYPTSSISGYVWIDEIANNELDESEIGNHGVNDTIVLTDLDGNWFDIVQVDTETGAYEIYDLLPGNYIVFLLENGSSSITNPIARHILSLDLGEQETDQNFILPSSVIDIPLTSISGYVWIDEIANNELDESEIGNHGVNDTIALTDLDGNLVDIVQVDTETGAYAIYDLPPGNYIVFLLENGSSSITNPIAQHIISLDLGEQKTDQNFILPSSEIDLPLTSISGYIWIDEIANNELDESEIGNHGVNDTIVLTDLDGNLVDIVQVDPETGAYEIYDLPPGNYIIILPEEDITNPFSPGEHYILLNLDLGEQKTEQNFILPYELAGFTSSISGYIWIDEIPNYERDESEIGYEGVHNTIVLEDLDQNVLATTVVDPETGAYLFADVPPGTYIVTLDQDTPLGPYEIMDVNIIVRIDIGTHLTAKNFILSPLDVGLGEPELLETPLHAYPIPCKDFVNIYSIEFVLTGYTIYNVTGQVVQSGSVDPNHEIRVDLPLLSHGIYHLELTTDTEGVIRREIVVVP